MKTIVFGSHDAINIPQMCVGCSTPTTQNIYISTGKTRGKSVAGKLAVKSGRLISGLLFGGIGAAAYDRLSGSDVIQCVDLYICGNCSNHIKTVYLDYIKKEVGDFFVPSISTNYFTCNVSSGIVSIALNNTKIAEDILSLNKGVVFDSVDAYKLGRGRKEFIHTQTFPIKNFLMQKLRLQKLVQKN